MAEKKKEKRSAKCAFPGYVDFFAARPGEIELRLNVKGPRNDFIALTHSINFSKVPEMIRVLLSEVSKSDPGFAEKMIQDLVIRGVKAKRGD
jgi:hypothetical protein